MRNNKRFLLFILLVLLFTSVYTLSVSADIGPKPSIRISFEQLGDELCYATLLSDTDRMGPHTAWDGRDAHARHNENESYSYANFDYEIWKAFAEYEDSDEYFFLQEGWLINETKELAWTYYPPYSFKLLLYYPSSGSFAVSDIYERYAFDSYYTVEIPQNADNILVLKKSYDHTNELLSLVVRIFATVLIETAVALLFGLRRKKEFLAVLGVNITTQIILNTALNVINYSAGWMAFTACYVFLEIIVFVVEAVIYSFIMKKLGENRRSAAFCVMYSFVANAVSFGIGLAAAHFIPGIF